MKNNKQFELWKKGLAQSSKLQKELNQDALKYLEAVKLVGEANNNERYVIGQIKEYEESSQEIEDSKLGKTKDEIKAINIKLKAGRALLGLAKKDLNTAKKITEEYAKQVKEVNKITLGVNSISNGLSKIPSLLKGGFSRLKGTGIFEVDKSIRDSAKSLNIAKSNANGFSDNLNTASKTTGMWGIHTKDLTKAQQSYSEEIGRSVILGEEGLVAIGEMAKGTHLGADGAAMMASEMDKFGMSVVGSRDLVQETVETAAKMGVNSAKAIKNLQSNLKLAQKFHFKGGVSAMAKMANDAARLKLDMDGIAGLAEQVFRPEGAVEMAAQFQVMGGAFAKMGDPMQLMFKARNDFAAFAKDIGNATSEFVQYNKETQTFDVKGGLAADRMREIAKITGIGVEKLQEMGVQQAKMNKFGGMISASIVDPEDRELVASLMEINSKGVAEVRLGTNDPLNVKLIQKADLERFKKEKASLAERAKEGETFEEVVNSIKTIFQSMLLPFARSLKEGLGDSLNNFISNANEKGYFKTIEKWGERIGSFVSTIGKFIIDNPFASVISILGAKGLMAAATWYTNGLSLAAGFNTLAGGTGGGGIVDSLTDLFGSKGKFMKNLAKGGKGLKFAKGIGGAGAGLLSAGVSGYDEYTSNKEAGMDDSENYKRTGTRAAAAGGGAWGGAALGATIGTMVFPGVGTAIGGLIGGIAGGLAGDKIGDSAGDMMFGNSTKIEDGVVQFHGNDKFMKVDDSTMIAGTNAGGNKDLAKAMSNGSGAGGGDVKHKFDDLNVNITIKSEGSWLDSIGVELSTDKAFIRDISQKIQEEIRMAIGGGKLNPNPL
jgi:hypothetical protein